MVTFQTKVTDFLQRLNEMVAGWLWVIAAAAIVLLLVLVIVLLIVIACKNATIRRLKKEAQVRSDAQALVEAVEAEERQEAQVEIVEAEEKQSETTETVRLLPGTTGTAQPQKEEKKEEVVPVKNEPPKPAEKTVAAEKKTNSFDISSGRSGNGKYIVKYERAKDSWVIKKEGVDRVIRRTSTKEEALSIARALCKNNDANLVVHKKDGKFQKQ